MSYVYNPLLGAGLDQTGAGVSALNVLGTVANAAALPGSATTGDVYQAEDTGVFYVWDGSAWDNLGTLVGPQGPTGDTGPTGPAGADGVGIPVGGANGQALVKASNTDYDTEWADVTAVAALDDLTDVTLTSPSDGQVLEYDSATSTWVNATPSGGGGTPGGSNTQVQFNDSNSFGGDDGLTFNKTTNELTVGASTGDGGSAKVYGDINLDDGGASTTTIQCVTPTLDRTISFPDATGTVALVAGSTGQLVYNNAGAQAGLTSVNIGSTGQINVSLAGAASTPPVTFTGSWFTGGTATTTKPQLLIEPSGTTSTAWSTSGTGIGVNAASGFSGNLLDLQVNGTSKFSVSQNGNISGTALKIESIGANDPGGLGIGTSASTTLAGYTGAGSVAWVSSVFGTGFILPSDAGPIGFSSAGRTSVSSVASSKDTLIYRDAAGILAQRNGTNAQTTRIYDTYTSSTDYHRIAIATARATLSNVSGASVTATGLIPAGAVVMGVTSKVTTALGTGNGTTGYKIGTGADDDRWGAITGTAAGTTSDNSDWTVGTIECFPSTTDVIVTATGGNFDGTGVIYLSVQYMAGEAD